MRHSHEPTVRCFARRKSTEFRLLIRYVRIEQKLKCEGKGLYTGKKHKTVRKRASFYNSLQESAGEGLARDGALFSAGRGDDKKASPYK